MLAKLAAVESEVQRLVGPVEIDRGPFEPVRPERLAAVIDHTLLKPEGTPAQAVQLCREAARHGFASVCINPGYVRLAARELAESGVPICTVVGFPLGATSTAAKVAETRLAIEDGAREIDMVLNIGRLLAREWRQVHDDIRAVVAACENRASVKVIMETCLLGEEEKIAACLLSVAAGAQYVKTSTGFSRAGATLEDVRLLRAVVGPHTGVKAAGGIRTREDALAMLEAGATRLGCSASLSIIGVE